MAQDPSGSGKNPPPQRSLKEAATQTGTGYPGSGQAQAAAPGIDPEQLRAILQALAGAGGLPITLSQATSARVPVEVKLNELTAVTVAFPPCADVLLALIDRQVSDEITRFFDEYFRFCRHEIVAQSPNLQLDDVLDPKLLECPSCNSIILSSGAAPGWPPPWCLPPSCVALRGNRRGTTDLKRLLLGDLVWLFFFERMGIFKILGVILDDFATRGGYPISNGAIDTTNLKDDVIALVLEAACRQTKTGLSSTVRDRDATYRRVLGWTSEWRPLGIPAQVNKGTSQLFHKFMQGAISFNNAKRLAIAIRGTTSPPAAASFATLTDISETLTLLKQRFETFHYGRSYYNTLSGIVWTIAALSLLRDLRTTLGIPPAFDEPHEFVPAAYDILVLKRTPVQTEINRYEAHKDCAEHGRNLLLDIAVLNVGDTSPGGQLELWLTQVEGEVESYRKAYRDLTGVDLGAAGTPPIEQEV